MVLLQLALKLVHIFERSNFAANFFNSIYRRLQKCLYKGLYPKLSTNIFTLSTHELV